MPGKWLTWTPKSTGGPYDEPTKPSKPIFVGFDGSPPPAFENSRVDTGGILVPENSDSHSPLPWEPKASIFENSPKPEASKPPKFDPVGPEVNFDGSSLGEIQKIEAVGGGVKSGPLFACPECNAEFEDPDTCADHMHDECPCWCPGCRNFILAGGSCRGCGYSVSKEQLKGDEYDRAR